MKILVITDVLWRTDNGVGNSYSNIFAGLSDVTIQNICCQEGKSDNSVSIKCFQISERRLIKNLLDHSYPPGVIEGNTSADIISDPTEGRLLRGLKRSRFQVLFWARNMIWKVGRWKTQEIKHYIDEFKPDLIFAQLQDKLYLNNLIQFVHDYSGKKLVLYVWDDVYSLKQFSLSPLFWIDRLIQRHSIRKLVKSASLLYTISKEQKEEYQKSLHIQTEILYKGRKFEEKPKTDYHRNKLKMLYAGNLYSDRYKTILEIAELIANKYNNEIQLDIYSGTTLSKSEIRRLNRCKSVYYHGFITEEVVDQLQDQSDILLHVEPLTLKGSLLCRLSFSTKLVDYFYKAKCIIAIGSERCSSIQYLKKHDAALVASGMKQLNTILDKLIQDRELIKLYSEKAWMCGSKNHQIDSIQVSIMNTFRRIITGDEYDEYPMDS